MSRIRTIKPEFFSSEDIFTLTPLARLFYVSLWCESDREGRLEWKLGTFKARYLPADDCDINALAAELIEKGLIILYQAGGKNYAEIPTFTEHQVINNRESQSKIPARVVDASVTRESGVKAEGKGREGKGREGEEPQSEQSSDEQTDAAPSIERRKREPSADDLALASRMFGLILDGNPTAKKPNLPAWADDIRLMREVDGRPLPEIWSLFQWVRRDSFWRANVLSPVKLREKWDQLTEKRMQPVAPGRGEPVVNEKFNFNHLDRSGDARAMAASMAKHGITAPADDEEIDI